MAIPLSVWLMRILSATDSAIENVKSDIIDHIWRIESEKYLLNHAYGTFLKLAQEDLLTPGIDVGKIVEISKILDEIGAKVRKMDRLLNRFQADFEKNRVSSKWLNRTAFRFICQRYEKSIEDFRRSQKLWLSQKTPEITESIRMFLGHHAEELQALDEKIQNQARSEEEIRNQSALQLQKARLEAHIGNLEKLRIRK